MNRRNAAGGMVLTVIWLITAAAALILTVVYFERLQKLYDRVDSEKLRVEAAQNAPGAGTAGAPAGNAGQDTGLNGATAADGAGQAGSAGTDITLAGEGGNPGGKQYSDAAQDTQNSDVNGQADSGVQESAQAGTDGNTDPAGDTAGTEENGSTQSGNDGTAGSTDQAGDGSVSETAEGGNAGENRTGTSNYDYSLGLDPDKPIIALSFDDGPSVYTDRIVAALQANHVEATFFMVGYNVREYKDKVRLVYDAGMEIGNHTSDHKKLTKIGEDEIRSQVFDNEDLINSIVPVGRIVVRPPYGTLNSTVKSIVNRPMFNWSVDSLDWKTLNADSVVAQIQQDAKDGYIILMHDLYESTAEAAERIIPWLIDHGYQVTSISKMFKARGVETEDGELYRMAQPAELR